MSRTNKGSKGPGYDYWTARPYNDSKCNSPSKFAKRRTHKAERQLNKPTEEDFQE